MPDICSYNYASKSTTEAQQTRSRLPSSRHFDCRLLPLADHKRKTGSAREAFACCGNLDSERDLGDFWAGPAAKNGTVPGRGPLVASLRISHETVPAGPPAKSASPRARGGRPGRERHRE